jgi:Protein of unknown function (DUF3137)
MEEIKDFESFYNIRLQPFFEELKSQGHNTSIWTIVGIISLIVTILSFMLNQPIIGTLFLFALVYCIYKHTKNKDLFVDNYKETVIKEIITYLNPAMIYSPESSMSSDDYEKSGHYRRIYDFYDGDDHIEGTYKNVKFYCSEIKTAHERPASRARRTTTIFKGLFFAAPLGIAFCGGTYIWPAGEEQLANSIMDEYYRLMDFPDVYYVDTKNPTFEKEFSVYSTNHAEALFFVDNELMTRLINFKNQINRDIRMSFVGGICYVSIAINEDLFQPSVSNPENKEIVHELFFSVLLILSIINQLNLTKYS